jgi:plastocyanin
VRLGVRVGQALRPRWGPGGEPVTSLRPGVYWLTVHDSTAFHNFHIFGPGADDVVTTVPFAGGNATVKIRVDHGTYTFQCDPHATLGMKGTFDVGGVAQVGA